MTHDTKAMATIRSPAWGYFECNRDFSPTDLTRFKIPCMEYRGIWISFCVLWLLLGAVVAVYPARVARLLRRKSNLPPPQFLTGWRMIGIVVAIGALAKLFSVLKTQ